MQELVIHHALPSILRSASEGVLLARGLTVPADASVGYAKGCLFIDTNGAAGAVLYVNEGTVASSDFNLALSDEGVLLTDGVTAGTWAASKACTLNSSGDATLVDGTDFAVGTSTGTKIGTNVSQKLGFWNATPVVQQASAAQAAVSPSGASAFDGGDSVGKAAVLAAVQAVETLVNRLRLDLVTTGIIKGSA